MCLLYFFWSGVGALLLRAPPRFDQPWGLKFRRFPFRFSPPPLVLSLSSPPPRQATRLQDQPWGPSVSSPSLPSPFLAEPSSFACSRHSRLFRLRWCWNHSTCVLRPVSTVTLILAGTPADSLRAPAPPPLSRVTITSSSRVASFPEIASLPFPIQSSPLTSIRARRHPCEAETSPDVSSPWPSTDLDRSRCRPGIDSSAEALNRWRTETSTLNCLVLREASPTFPPQRKSADARLITKKKKEKKIKERKKEKEGPTGASLVLHPEDRNRPDQPSPLRSPDRSRPTHSASHFNTPAVHRAILGPLYVPAQINCF